MSDVTGEYMLTVKTLNSNGFNASNELENKLTQITVLLQLLVHLALLPFDSSFVISWLAAVCGTAILLYREREHICTTSR